MKRISRSEISAKGLPASARPLAGEAACPPMAGAKGDQGEHALGGDRLIDRPPSYFIQGRRVKMKKASYPALA